MAFVHKVASAVPDILYVYDIQAGRNVYCNREIASVLGYSPQEVFDFGTDLFARLLHPDDFEAIAQGHEKLDVSEDGAVVEVSYRMCHKDGEWHWLRSRDTVFARDSQGNVLQKIGVAHDVTSERQAQQELMEAVERYSSLVSILTDWVWEVDLSGLVTYVSPQVTQPLGYSPAELVGKNVFDFMPLEEVKRVRETLSQVIAAHEAFQAFRQTFFAKDGRLLHIEINGIPIFHVKTGECIGYRGVNRDITAQHAMEVEREALLSVTRQRADEDPLTALLNRSAFDRELNRHLSQTLDGATRSPVENAGKNRKRPLAILLLDLDNLKFFNDAFGHAAGDDVLVRIADTLRSCCRKDDVLARLSGDEFAVVLVGASRAEAETRLMSMKKAVSDIRYRPPQPAGSAAIEPVAIPLNISGGVAVAPDDGITALAVRAVADERLYSDKTAESQVDDSDRLRADLATSLPGFAALDAVVTAVDARNRYVLRHSEDVMANAAVIGEAMGLSADQLEALGVAALLHDVGTFAVPESLLRLPGPLSDDEYATVKLHAALGASFVESGSPEIARRMPTVIPAIRHHHERWDGAEGGYPDRLVGKAIPLHARILAVADAFSSMTNDRPYRHGAERPEAFARLQAGSGSQWDSLCVNALIDALETTSERRASGLPKGNEIGHETEAASL